MIYAAEYLQCTQTMTYAASLIYCIKPKPEKKPIAND